MYAALILLELTYNVLIILLIKGILYSITGLIAAEIIITKKRGFNNSSDIPA